MTTAIFISCNSHDTLFRFPRLLKATQLCTLSKFFQSAPCHDWTSLGLSLYSFIILTVCVGIALETRIILFWRVLGCVFPRFFVTNELHIQNTLHNHKVEAEQVVKDLVVSNVPLKKILS